ncbi:hypothetical protein SMICM304S_03665 [Streptomyces microflavus]
MTQRIRPGTVAALALLLAAATGCTGQQPPAPAPSAPPSAARGAGGQDADGPRPFTLLASGDVLPHSSVIDRAGADAGGQGYDFAPMLKGVAPVVSRADLAICHMETVYGKEGGPYTGYPSFKSPPEVATALRATGFDSCSTASNHTLDDGSEGVDRTLGALDAAGIRHAGSARSAAEAARPTILPAGPGKRAAKVAHLAYTYGTNDIPLPAGKPWTVNVTDERKIVAEARKARRAARRRRRTLRALGHRMAGRTGRRAAGTGRAPHRLPAGRPPRPRPDHRHPRPCAAGVREGQRHLGRLRHGRPDRRRDDQLPGRPGPARQPELDGPLHLRAAGAAGRALDGEEGRVRPAVVRHHHRAFCRRARPAA